MNTARLPAPQKPYTIEFPTTRCNMVSQNKHCRAVAGLTALRASISPTWDKTGGGWVGSPRPIMFPTVNSLKGPGIPGKAVGGPSAAPAPPAPGLSQSPAFPVLQFVGAGGTSPAGARPNERAFFAGKARPGSQTARSEAPRLAGEPEAAGASSPAAPAAAGPTRRARAEAIERAERDGPQRLRQRAGAGRPPQLSFVLPLLQRTGREESPCRQPAALTHCSGRPGPRPVAASPQVAEPASSGRAGADLDRPGARGVA